MFIYRGKEFEEFGVEVDLERLELVGQTLDVVTRILIKDGEDTIVVGYEDLEPVLVENSEVVGVLLESILDDIRLSKEITVRH